MIGRQTLTVTVRTVGLRAERRRFRALAFCRAEYGSARHPHASVRMNVELSALLVRVGPRTFRAGTQEPDPQGSWPAWHAPGLVPMIGAVGRRRIQILGNSDDRCFSGP